MRRRLPWLVFAVPLLVFAGLTVERGGVDADWLWLLPFVAYGVVGAFLASRRPENRIGWVFLAVAVLGSLAALDELVARLLSVPGWQGVGVALRLLSPLGWIGGLGTMLSVALLLFPDGRLPSPRWRVVMVAALVGMPLMAYSDVAASFPIALPPRVVSVLELLGAITAPVLLLVAVFSAASLVVRFRRSAPEQRQQLKWFVSAAALAAVYFLVVIAAEGVTGEESRLSGALGLGFPLVLMTIPVSAGIAILRYRLYDIDLVINKTLVYGALAAFITAVYVGVVVGVGAAIGGGEESNLALSIGATALVAVAFQPVRERVQRVVNRMVYGRRTSPYQTLSRFSDRVAGSYGGEDVLPRMARVVADGTGARRAEVWLRVGGTLRTAAAWPPTEAVRNDALALRDGDLPEIAGVDRAYPVRHRDELLGALTVVKAPGDPVRPQEEALLGDLASQAGLVLRNVRLMEELRARLGDVSRLTERLQGSRRRIVATQDAERRKLERNIHDGAQQHLVALAVQLNLARAMVERAPDRARPLLQGLVHATKDAIGELRDLARGIYPPVLEAEGLAAAIRAQGDRSPVAVEVEADRIGRHPLDVEAAVYFCVLEALQNVAKYADAARARVRLSEEEEGVLRFEVVDDGKGFDPQATAWGSGLQNMADRLAALGGTVTLDSAPGAGTTVTGAVPVGEAESLA